MLFLASDLTHDTLLFAAPAFNANGQIFSIQVVRGGGGHITGFSGSPTLIATTPNVDSCLVYGPASIAGASSLMFYETFASSGSNANLVGELKPGSTTPDKTVSMTPKGVTSSMGGLDFVPANSGFDAAAVGHLKLQSFTGNTFFVYPARPRSLDARGRRACE